MQERRLTQRGRTLLGGKIIFNSGQSAIDCTVRNLSDDGACLAVSNVAGIPKEFHLRISGEAELRTCTFAWANGDRVGVSFGHREANAIDVALPVQMDALRAALDVVGVGIVLLDSELRAQFINSTFRTMWRLPDAKADSKPAFVALMYHGRDTRAYAVNAKDIDAYVAHRVSLVKEGNTDPVDVRLASGEVVRFQCSPLPDGGRMLVYTFVSDIVTHSDELELLKAAINQVDEGILLLDSELNAQFMNAALRKLWKVSDVQLEKRANYRDLVSDYRYNGVLGLTPQQLETFISQRIARVIVGDPTPQDIALKDGRHVRSKCAVLPAGGRMLTFSDVTDLVKNAQELQKLATTDSMTGLYNRRHFLVLAEAEWGRFQRYQRPLSILMVDIDHFKRVNDKFGHATGDMVLTAVANACLEDKRSSDVVGRIGGEEFAMLLPETDLEQADIVAERVRQKIMSRRLLAEDTYLNVTVSIGIAQATIGMSSVGILLKAADQSLYKAKAQGRNRIVRYEPVLVNQRLAAE